MKKFLPLLIFLFFIVSYYLVRDEAIIPQGPFSHTSHMEFVKITHRNNNETKWRADIESIHFSENEKSADLREIRLHMIEDNISLRARKGTYDLGRNSIHLLDDVVAFNKDYEVLSDTLHWDLHNRSLSSNDKVTISAKNFTIVADSLSTSRDGRVNLSGNVRAVFHRRDE